MTALPALTRVSALAVLLLMPFYGRGIGMVVPTESPWNPYPVGRTATFLITAFGAVGDNRTKNTAAIQGAIDSAGRAGGGMVVVPAGAFLTGSVNLTSNVYLYLEPGGVLQGTADWRDYNYDWDQWHVVQGRNLSNTGVVGPAGLPAGQGGEIRGPMWQMIDEYDPATDSFRQKTWAQVHGCVGECRPKNLAFVDCTNVTVAGVRLTASSDWTQLFRRCNNVLEDRTWVEGALQWGNNDGLDVESGSNITISNGVIKTGDDALAFRAGNCNLLNHPWPLLPDGTTQPLNGVTVRNMTLTSTSAAIKIGQLGQAHHGDILNVDVAHINITRTNRGIDLLQRNSNATMRNISFRHMDIQTQLMTEPEFWGSGEPIVLSAVPGDACTKAAGLKGFESIRFASIRARGENGILVSSMCQADPTLGLFKDVVFDNVQLTIGTYGNVTRAVRDYRPLPPGLCGPDLVAAKVDGFLLENIGFEDVSFRSVSVDVDQRHPPKSWSGWCVREKGRSGYAGDPVRCNNSSRPSTVAL